MHITILHNESLEMLVRKVCLGWNSAQEWIYGENTKETSFVVLLKDEGDQEHPY